MVKNTGLRLRSMYEDDGGNPAVFGRKVDDYDRSRPDYPAELFEALLAACPKASSGMVVDVGAGTGLLTAGLLDAGCRVVAVEPSREMRAASDHRLGNNPAYRSAAGSAETLPLEAATADLITAAQAFHWFDVPAARAEFLRVLKADGQVALIWNDRVLDDPVNRQLDPLFAEFGGEKRGAMLAHEDRSQVQEFFGSTTPEIRRWPHGHRLDAAGLEALVFSRSYMPGRDTDAGKEVQGRVRAIFDGIATGGTLVMPYTTVLYLGRPL